MKIRNKITLPFAMAALLAAGCSNASDGSSLNSSTTEAAETKPVTLRIFSSKVELAEAFNSLKEDYEASHPGVTLEIETQLSEDYNTNLKAKLASGELPDLFNNEGNSDLDLWSSYLEDLSGESWVTDMVEESKNSVTRGEAIYGFPFGLEGTGIVYNKDLFEQAGITDVPTTLSGLREAAEKLDAAGIKPFINPYASWYGPGVFEANNAVAKQSDPDTFIAGLNDGSASIVDNAVFKDWQNLLDLQIEFGHKEPLATDYSMQMTDLANGAGAMTITGNFAQALLDEINPNLNIGVMPIPLNDDATLNDNIFIGVPTYWVVNKNSPVKEEAKEFLEWLAETEEGNKYITDQFHLIPAFKSIPATEEALGKMGAEIKRYVDEGKTLGWQWSKYPEGVTTEWGSSVQKYASGAINKEQMLEEFQAAWEKLNK